MKTVHILGNKKAEIIEVPEPEPIDNHLIPLGLGVKRFFLF